MRVRDVVRAAVVFTNPFWPFSQANRVPYRLALRAVRRRLAALPQVAEVYLRHGLLRPDWVPGLSDIDLTVMVRDEADARRDFENTRGVWGAMEALRTLYPMIGETIILPESSLDAWTTVNVTGYESKDWKPLLGHRRPGSAYHASAERLRIDALTHAMTLFQGSFLRAFGEGPGRVRDARLRRMACKIARYAGRPGAPVGEQTASWALKCLDGAAREIGSPLRVASESRIEAPYLRPIVIVEAEDDLERLMPRTGPLPMIHTRASFEYALAYDDPYLFIRLVESQRIRSASRLPEALFGEAVRSQLHNVLVAPRERILFSPGARDFLGGRGFTITVERASFLRLLQTRGSVPGSYRELSSENAGMHADFLRRAEGIAASGDVFAAFELLRELAGDAARRGE